MINSSPRETRQSADQRVPAHGAGVPRRLSIVLMLLAAAIVSGVAGLLSHAAGNNVPGAILTGGGAFAGTLGLLLAVAHYAGDGDSR